MFATLVILVLLLIVFYYKQKHLENLPPGPPWYRFLANLKALSPAHIQKEVPKLREKYGDIMCVTRVIKTTIVISGRDALRDIFIKNANWTSERPDSVIKIMGDGLDAQLHVVIQNFFIAGTETTVTTIRWLVLYLIHFPEVQRKMREEIDRVIGPSRLPSLEDKAKLPYCQAVINETNRISSIIPYSVPHGVSKEFYYRGHRIPKGATLFPNLVSVAMDPEVFPNPEKFDPSRFIDRDGNFFGQESIYPFSLGRRACLGESLARMELLLFTTALVQRFELHPANPDKLPSLEGLRILTYSPQPYAIKAVKRT